MWGCQIQRWLGQVEKQRSRGGQAVTSRDDTHSFADLPACKGYVGTGGGGLVQGMVGSSQKQC
jgi:hypothetical protein